MISFALMAACAPSAAAAPPNDDFVNAARLEGFPASVEASNEGGTVEPEEPWHGDPTYPSGGRSLWWRWVAPRTGPVAVQTCGTSFPTALGVYTGDALADGVLPC